MSAARRARRSPACSATTCCASCRSRSIIAMAWSTSSTIPSVDEVDQAIAIIDLDLQDAQIKIDYRDGLVDFIYAWDRHRPAGISRTRATRLHHFAEIIQRHPQPRPQVHLRFP